MSHESVSILEKEVRITYMVQKCTYYLARLRAALCT